MDIGRQGKYLRIAICYRALGGTRKWHRVRTARDNWARVASKFMEEPVSMRVAPKIVLSGEERKMLDRWSKGDHPCERVAMRAKIILLAAQGMMNIQIAKKLKVARFTVTMWRQRFVLKRLAGIEEEMPRPKRQRKEYDRLMPQILEKTIRETPPNGKRWTLHSMADELHTSMAMVQHVWRDCNLKPHLMTSSGASSKRTGRKVKRRK
jgi:transposase